MSGYDLYTSLGLSRAEPPEQLAEQLDRRLSEIGRASCRERV